MLNSLLRKRKLAPDGRREESPPDFTLAGGVPTIRDIVAPDGFEVAPSHVRVGPDRWVSCYVVSAFPSRVAVGLLDALWSVGDVDAAVHLYPADPRQVVNELTRRITTLESNRLMAERRGDTRDVSLLLRSAETCWRLRDQIQANENKLFYVTVAFAVAAPTEEALRARCEAVESVLGARAVHARRCFLRQSDALPSVAPTGENRLADAYKTFDLLAGTALFPFGSADVAHEGGVLFGQNLITGAPVVYNCHAGPPVLANPHMGVFATTGAGKTYFVNLLSARSALRGERTVFLDPEGGYSRMVKRCGGVVVAFEPGRPSGVNPLDVEEEGNSVNLVEKVLDIRRLVSAMAESQGEAVTAEESALVEEAAREEYRKRGITSDASSLYEKGGVEGGRVSLSPKKKAMPTLGDLVAGIASRPSGRRLSTLLRPYLRDGTQGLFDCETSVSLSDSPLVSFDVSSLEERYLRPIAMHVLLEWIWNRFVKKTPGIKKRVVVDEAWIFMKNRDTAEFLENMARRSRKRLCSLCVVSQSFREFSESPQGRAVLSNLGTVVLMQQAAKEVDDLARAFKLSEGEKAFLLTAGVGTALLKAGRNSVAFLVTSSEDERAVLVGEG